MSWDVQVVPGCPGMSQDVPWPDRGPQVPGLLSPICPGRLGTSQDIPGGLGHPRTSRDTWDQEDILGLVGQLMAIPDNTDGDKAKDPSFNNVKVKFTM